MEKENAKAHVKKTCPNAMRAALGGAWRCPAGGAIKRKCAASFSCLFFVIGFFFLQRSTPSPPRCSMCLHSSLALDFFWEKKQVRNPATNNTRVLFPSRMSIQNKHKQDNLPSEREEDILLETAKYGHAHIHTPHRHTYTHSLCIPCRQIT